MSVLEKVKKNIEKSGTNDPVLLGYLDRAAPRETRVTVPGKGRKRDYDNNYAYEPEKIVVEGVTVPEMVTGMDMAVVKVKKKKKTGRPSKPGPRKGWKQKKAAAGGLVIADVLTGCQEAQFVYTGVSAAMFGAVHRCNLHSDQYQCKSLPALRKEYSSVRDSVKRLCKIK